MKEMAISISLKTSRTANFYFILLFALIPILALNIYLQEIFPQALQHPPGSLSTSKKKFMVDIVVAYCQKNISWLEKGVQDLLSTEVISRKIYIYCMCGREPYLDLTGQFMNLELIINHLPNRGRNDMAFTYHIVSDFNKISEVDYIFFFKDSMMNYPITFIRNLLLPLKEVSQQLRLGSSFICLQRPDAGGMDWHVRQETWKFRLPYYASADNYKTMKTDKNFKRANGTMCRFLQDVLGPTEFDHLKHNEFIKVCYGGNFVVRTNKIQQIPFSVWQRILERLRIHENGEVMHFMERTWAALLSDSYASTRRIIIENRSLISFPHLQFIDQEGRSYPGMQLLKGEKSDPLALSTTVTILHQSRPSILLVSHELTRTGAPLYLLHVAKILVQRGENVFLIAPSDGSLSHDFWAEGVEVIISNVLHFKQRTCAKLSCPTPTDLIQDIVQTKTGLRPDTVLWNTIVWADILSLSGQSRYCQNSPQMIWVIHEWVPEVGNSWKRLRAISSESKQRQVVLSVDAIVFCSELARRQWQRFDGLVPFSTIHGFSKLHDTDGPSSSNITRKNLKIPSDAFVVTTVGTICLRKQQHWAITAISELRQRGINAVLLMIGDTETDKDFFLKRILPGQEELGNDTIQVIPEQVDIAPYLLLANLHISSSREETYPLNTLEAMALSIPVVATRAGGTEEQFSHDAQWMTSEVDLDDFVATVYKAATMHNLSEYGKILSQKNRHNEHQFQRKTEDLVDAVRSMKKEDFRCGLLIDCKKVNN